MLRKVLIISILGISVNVSADSEALCPQQFALISEHITRLSKNIPDRHRQVIADAALKQFGDIVKRLPQEDLAKFVQVLSDVKIAPVPGSPTAGGAIVPTSGLPDFYLTPESFNNPLALAISIHEAQHLADILRPTRSLVRPRSLTRKLETRSFLRQHAFLDDVTQKIGLEGVVDLVLQSGGIPLDRRADVKSMLQVMLQWGSEKSADKYAGMIAAGGLEELEATWKLLGIEPGSLQPESISTQMFWNLSDRTRYVQHRLKLEPYETSIQRELKISESMDQFKDLARRVEEANRKMKWAMAWLTAAVAGGALASYQLLQASPESSR